MTDDEPQFASASHDQFTLASQDGGDIWRDEVASRVESYRAKRRRRLGRAGSMELDFEPRPAEPAPTCYPPAAPAQYSAVSVAIAPEPQPEPAPAPEPLTARWDGFVEPAAPAPQELVQEQAEVPRLPDVWNVIRFPAPTDEAPRYELAEPVLDTPRILDAPEMFQQSLPTPMAEINLENEEPAELPEDLEIPLQVVPLPQRVFGGVADFTVVLVACALFALIAQQISGSIPVSKAVLAIALVVPCIFWIAYQYMFLVYAGRTPGMQLARVSLGEFDGEPVGARLRRWRAWALALSTVSLGLGFIWALVDEDTLCWHDRITRTYPIEARGDNK